MPHGHTLKPIASVVLAITLSTVSLAQTPPQPARNTVTITQVKPDMLNEWLDLQRTEVLPALRKAGVASRTVLQTIFGNTYEYVTVTPFTKYGDRDGQSPFDKAIGSDCGAASREAAQVRRKLAELREHQHSRVKQHVGHAAWAGLRVNSSKGCAWKRTGVGNLHKERNPAGV